jgi:alpha-amylase
LKGLQVIFHVAEDKNMSSICLYFQVHQPRRLRHTSFFSTQGKLDYFDDELNRDYIQKISERCYLPANKVLLKLCQRFGKDFRVAFSFTGVVLEQLQKYCPLALESFQQLYDTGCVEILGETYYHSLASLYDPVEFHEQLLLHASFVEQLFGAKPTTFRNTELIFSDKIDSLLLDKEYKAILTEGCDDILDGRSPCKVYKSKHTSTPLLLKHYSLSDDIAFRFSNQSWSGYPLTAEKYASWIASSHEDRQVVNLFMDYETFGEHQWQETGIFEFLNSFPEILLNRYQWRFQTPKEVAQVLMADAEPLEFPRTTSWADQERDASAWNGNPIQQSALRQLYELADAIRWQGDDELLATWRNLQISDHFYYMCTKWSEDGDVHKYFSPYEGPYEAFINYMNVLRNFREQFITRTGLLRFQAA